MNATIAAQAASEAAKGSAPETAKGVMDMDEGTEMDVEARLAVAEAALAAIAGENDLTCLRALFRMRRRAEEALARIRPHRRPLS